MTTYRITEGRASPMGATVDEDGVNFAVFSQHATEMLLCLFDDNGVETRLALPERDGKIWHGYVEGLRPGAKYGFRAHGPYRPDEGHRFNVNKLLMDPYARRLTGHPVWDDALFGFEVGNPAADLSFDTRDSANFMPRSVVEDFTAPRADHPNTTMAKTIIYEAHAKGLTAGHPALRGKGTLEALTAPEILDHLNALGVTAIELLPVHAFINDRFLVDQGLTNYWGYQSIGFFAPDPRYLGDHGIGAFRQMVDAYHAAGIEVLLDVVYNHSGEGDHIGPTLAFRGLDNASYYRLQNDPRYYINDTGTGNTLNIEHPMVLRMVMDSLRYWVEVMGVDGFRFDLCSALGRTPSGFDRGAAFFDAIRQDPTLTGVKLIAEPWDIGPGGYQLGAYPAPFAEWNDKYRDGVRRFWRADPGRVPDLAGRLTGSAAQFDHTGRPATSSVNFLTAHDGFTLMDTVSYAEKHNLANGEDGRDGHSENYSDNMGVEGATDDPDIIAARAARLRAMLATLLLSQGTPMLLAGDELGHSQGGNNNAYNQDNETAWINWADVDEDTLSFTKSLIAFRKAHPVLRQKRFLHSRERAADGVEDLFWWKADGTRMAQGDWNDPSRKLIVAEMRTAAGTPDYADTEYAVLLIFNAGDEAEVVLPLPPDGQKWRLEIDSAVPSRPPEDITGGTFTIEAQSAAAFVLYAPNET